MKKEQAFEEILSQTKSKSDQKKARRFSIILTILAIFASMFLVFLAVTQTARYALENQRVATANKLRLEEATEYAEMTKMQSQEAARELEMEKQRAVEEKQKLQDEMKNIFTKNVQLESKLSQVNKIVEKQRADIVSLQKTLEKCNGPH